MRCYKKSIPIKILPQRVMFNSYSSQPSFERKHSNQKPQACNPNSYSNHHKQLYITAFHFQNRYNNVILLDWFVSVRLYQFSSLNRESNRYFDIYKISNQSKLVNLKNCSFGLVWFSRFGLFFTIYEHLYSFTPLSIIFFLNKVVTSHRFRFSFLF